MSFVRCLYSFSPQDEPRMRRMKPSRMAAAETIDGDFFPVTNQFDKVTGDEISPKYSVPAVPAMMWDAPGTFSITIYGR